MAALHHLAVSLRSRDDDADVEFIDAEYWMKGCSSLGKLRLAALCSFGNGRKRDLALMDVKDAVKPAAPRYVTRRCRKTIRSRLSKALHTSRSCSANGGATRRELGSGGRRILEVARLLTQIVDAIMCALTCEKLARLVQDIGLTAELRDLAALFVSHGS